MVSSATPTRISIVVPPIAMPVIPVMLVNIMGKIAIKPRKIAPMSVIFEREL
jgi:hypothetical protein